MGARQPIRTRTGLISKRDGIVWAVLLPVEQTLEDAKENLKTVFELAGSEPCPLLVDIRNGVPLEAEVRHHYSVVGLEAFTKLAMLIQATPLGLMMGNLYFNLARHKIPMKLFQKEDEAIQWLLKVA